MSKIQVLLTGSTGFVGQNFKTNYNDHYDIKSVNLRENRPDQVSFSGIDTVVHLAALVHQMKGAPEEAYFKINTQLTEELATEAKRQGVRHFVCMSSAHVYGQQGNLDNLDEVLTEHTPCKPTDAYGQSKLAAEEIIQKLQDKNFTVSIIRSPMVYGPGGKGNLNLLKKLIEYMPILPFKNTRNKRSIIFINNLCHFIHLVITAQKPGIFLPQDGESISIEQLVRFIAGALDRNIYTIKIPSFLISILNFIIPKITKRLYGTLALDSTNSNRVLNYIPHYTTEHAIRITFKPEQSHL